MLNNEELTSWYSSIQKKSWLLEDYNNSFELDDSFIWAKKLHKICDRVNGVLLIGPSGCGKHQATGFLIKALAEQEYESIFLYESSFMNDDLSVIKEKIDFILKDFEDAGKPVCIVADQLGSGSNKSNVLEYLGQILCEHSMKSSEFVPMFLVVIADDECDIPALCRKQLQMIRFTYPNSECRARFVASNDETVKYYLDINQFVELTDGFSYCDIMDVIKGLTLIIEQCEEEMKEPNLNEMISFIEEQKPERLKVTSGERISNSDGQISLLTEAFTKMAEDLKNVVASGSINSPMMNASVDKQEADAVPAYIDDTSERSRLNDLRLAELTVELFGQDRADQLLNSVSQ